MSRKSGESDGVPLPCSCMAVQVRAVNPTTGGSSTPIDTVWCCLINVVPGARRRTEPDQQYDPGPTRYRENPRDLGIERWAVFGGPGA